jgi:hypothetical protein
VSTVDHPYVAADGHRIALDPSPTTELEIGAENHDIAANRLVDPEINQDSRPPGRGRARACRRKREQQAHREAKEY